MTDREHETPRWNRVRLQWTCIIVAGAVAAALGFTGFWRYFREQGVSGTAWDGVYQTALLFMFQFEGELGSKPWPLEVARFLAPAVTSYTVVLALLRVLGRRWQLARLTGHVVVCGLGNKGVYLAKKALRAGERVVIIEADEDNDWLDVCRSLGAVVLNGDAADEDMLRQARAAFASQVIAVCEKDTANIQIAALAGALARPAGLPPLRCLVHIGSLKWCASVRSMGLLGGAETGCAPQSFNFFENSARALLSEHPLDYEWIGPDDPRQAHLILIDANDMAMALLIQTVRVAHFSNEKRPRITVIDPDPDKERNLFYAQFPFADQVADIEFRPGTAQEPSVRRDLVDWAADGKSLMTVAVCMQEETVAMETALTLPAELRKRGVPIFVRLAEESGIAGILEGARQKIGVRAFGSIEDGCRIRDDLDREARALHEVYLAKAKRDGRTVGQDPGLRPWDDLDTGFKDSNRQAADHIPIKLRAVGCVAVPASEAPDGATFEFTDEEVEILSRMEHARWCAERFLAGWSLGPADKPNLVSPYLVSYDQLEDKIKEYDRAPVRSIPKLLWDHAGVGVKRAPSFCSRVELKDKQESAPPANGTKTE